MLGHAMALQFRDEIVRKRKLVAYNYLLDELYNVGVYKGRAFFIGGTMRKQRNQYISKYIYAHEARTYQSYRKNHHENNCTQEDRSRPWSAYDGISSW